MFDVVRRDLNDGTAEQTLTEDSGREAAIRERRRLSRCLHKPKVRHARQMLACRATPHRSGFVGLRVAFDAAEGWMVEPP